MLSEYIVAERKATRANADWGPVEVRAFRPAQAAGVRDTGPSNKLDDYRPAYPSDLTNSEWRAIEPLIPPAKSGGRPSKYERRDPVSAKDGMFVAKHAGGASALEDRASLLQNVARGRELGADSRRARRHFRRW